MHVNLDEGSFEANKDLSFDVTDLGVEQVSPVRFGPFAFRCVSVGSPYCDKSFGTNEFSQLSPVYHTHSSQLCFEVVMEIRIKGERLN